MVDVDLAAADGRAPARRAATARRRAARRRRCRCLARACRSRRDAAAPDGRRAASRRAARRREAEVYAALVLGLRDYVEKNGFGHVVLGLSGGIDSALVACVAVDALGAERVTRRDHALALLLRRAPRTTPARWPPTSASRRVELRDRRRRWRPTTRCSPRRFAGRAPDITEENLQARIRGNLLMALSNKFGWLVLTTGNKSEMSVGYSTLYGDLGRRLRGDQGRAQDAGLPTSRATATRVGGRRARAREHHRRARRAPSCAPTSATRTRCRPTSVLDRILEAYVEEDVGPRAADRAGACPPRTSTA